VTADRERPQSSDAGGQKILKNGYRDYSVSNGIVPNFDEAQRQRHAGYGRSELGRQIHPKEFVHSFSKLPKT